VKMFGMSFFSRISLAQAFSIAVLMAVLLGAAVPRIAKALIERPDLQAFIDEMVAKHAFDKGGLTELFSQARLRPDVLRVMSRPAEAKPWYKYRPLFVTDSRAAQGAEFWSRHAKTLARAEAAYGVPPALIVAIMGVETYYGKNIGQHRVLDALTTLALEYPRRSQFFRSELEQFLLLTREEELNALELKGSYAGAMGKPQFISSSYRRYAVDFDQDGRRDLIGNTTDAIGSVGNYLKAHGWKNHQPIVSRATVHGNRYKRLLKQGLKPRMSLREIKTYGVETAQKLPADLPATLIELDAKNGPEYWVGLENFYVITRYNPSPLYAMAVYQLSEMIQMRYGKDPAT
jgi:membrane-bound lytic murein transglycosylase B